MSRLLCIAEEPLAPNPDLYEVDEGGRLVIPGPRRVTRVNRYSFLDFPGSDLGKWVRMSLEFCETLAQEAPPRPTIVVLSADAQKLTKARTRWWTSKMRRQQFTVADSAEWLHAYRDTGGGVDEELVDWCVSNNDVPLFLLGCTPDEAREWILRFRGLLELMRTTRHCLLNDALLAWCENRAAGIATFERHHIRVSPALVVVHGTPLSVCRPFANQTVTTVLNPAEGHAAWWARQ